MTKAYLIHGTSTRDDDWFPWLEEAVAPAIKLDRIWLPEPFNPSPIEWAQAIDQQVPAEDGVVLVAHSLGCISALRFIERHRINDARLLLVGAFDQPLPTYPQLDRFVTPPLQYDQVTPKVSQATVIAAQDDYNSNNYRNNNFSFLLHCLSPTSRHHRSCQSLDCRW